MKKRNDTPPAPENQTPSLASPSTHCSAGLCESPALCWMLNKCTADPDAPESEEERLMNKDEYDDGINDYQAGCLRTSNGHQLGTDEWKAWDAGWMAAQNAEPRSGISQQNASVEARQ